MQQGYGIVCYLFKPSGGYVPDCFVLVFVCMCVCLCLFAYLFVFPHPHEQNGLC